MAARGVVGEQRQPTRHGGERQVEESERHIERSWWPGPDCGRGRQLVAKGPGQTPRPVHSRERAAGAMKILCRNLGSPKAVTCTNARALLPYKNRQAAPSPRGPGWRRVDRGPA